MDKKVAPEKINKELEELHKKLNSFKDKILEKFSDYVLGIALLPPKKNEKGEKVDDKINVLVLINDQDTKKLTPKELEDKLNAIFQGLAKEIDNRLNPSALLISELWQNCYEGKYEYLKLIATSAAIYDKGMLAAIKLAEVHKTMVLNKFERYIVSYVLSGSLTQGKATENSDVDVFVVVDDTDVRKMTRGELKEKLRAIIIGMGMEAGEATGILNKLNIQVYILTEFWESLRDANPVIFTLLRYGVPFYDRGIFMPWKQLLSMGKIKPSREAIDMFMSSGERIIKNVKTKITEIGMEDIYYALLTPSQAALMHYGLAPPTPRETPKLMKEIFVDKEKLLNEDEISVLEEVISLRKAIEHKQKARISGKEIDELLEKGENYLKNISKLFTKIDNIKSKESLSNLISTLKQILRKILAYFGFKKVDDESLLDTFKKELVDSGELEENYFKTIKEILNSESSKKLSKQEIEKLVKKGDSVIRALQDYFEKKRFFDIERAKLRITYGKDKLAEALFTKNKVFVIKDLKTKECLVANTKSWDFKKIEYDELDSEIRNEKTEFKTEISLKEFNKIKELFGDNCKILLK
ncbi:MAG: hypothetical protein PWP03_683 [Candidatus Woesearchaeota archaeon]|nr:hypothetical protein [Candidatus Woesearchaeota archaeon]